MDERENARRLAAYRKDPGLEAALAEANERLRGLEDAPAARAPERGPFFVVGIQRSGTTLLMQLLSRTFPLTYPDNVSARFWTAAWLGIVVSRSLRAQMGGGAPAPLTSAHGVTTDPFGPHEFGYFWERWFDFSGVHRQTPAQLAQVDVPGLLRSLSLMERHGGHPLLFKAVPLSFNLEYLAAIFPGARFLCTARDPLFSAQSTLLARVARYGSEEAWFSLKPPEYPELLALPPLEQVAGQVRCNLAHLRASLARVEPARCRVVSYAELCADPAGTLASIGSFLGLAPAPDAPAPPARLTSGDVRRLAPERLAALERALAGCEAW